MANLTLHFTGGTRPELERTVFSHQLLSEQKVCVRGKTSGAHLNSGSFQWTAGVKAVAIFFLRVKARVSDDQSPILEGQQGSVAASMDFALGKMPLWLMDMFGVDAQGVSLTQRVITRTNPELKRPGPVALSLNKKVLTPDNIKITWNGTTLESSDQVGKLMDAIESQVVGLESSRLHTNPTNENGVSYERSWKSLLSGLLEDEIHRMLNETDIFRRQVLQTNLRKLSENPRLLKLGLTPSSLELNLDSSLSSSARLGVSDDPIQLTRLLKSEQPWHVALSVSQVGALALLAYLKFFKGYSLDINLRYPHSLQLAEMLAAGENLPSIDLCTLAIGPATKLLSSKSKEFQALMVMPRQSYRALAPLSAKRRAKAEQAGYSGEFLMVENPYSDALLYLDALESRNLIDTSEIEIRNMEPDEVGHAFSAGEDSLRSIVGFPYYALGVASGKGIVVGDITPDISLRESILFVKREHLAKRDKITALDIALRDAWLTIRNDPVTLTQVVATILDETEYSSLVRRFWGMES